MNIDTTALFAIPVSRFTISTNVESIVTFFNQKIKNNKTVDTITYHDKNLINYHNAENIFELYSELDTLKKELLKTCNFIYKHIMNHHKSGDLYFTNSWFNLCQIDGSQRLHTHANCVLCGTLYLNVDEKSNLCFQSPFHRTGTACILADDPDSETPNEYGFNFHQNLITTKLKTGDCFIWPSYLDHGYFDNQTPNRLSLSFNLMPSKLNHIYNSN